MICSSRRAAIRCLIVLSLIATIGTLPRARAQTAPGDLLTAVVGIEAEVPTVARTARTLGTTRSGSGAVISDDGLVVTIGYLILEAMAVDIIKQDGRRVPADVVAYDHETGFGLVRAREKIDVTPLVLGDSAALTTSQQALVATRHGTSRAIGVRVVDRRDFAGSWEYLLEDAIFTSPPHREFGGAALLGPDGSLVGIGSLFVGDAAGPRRPSPGNMFVPIAQLRPILGDLIENGRRAGPYRPWLGVYPEAAQGHVFLGRIAKDSPAEAAGLGRGDLVITVNENPVSNIFEFYREIWSAGDAGTTIPVQVLHPNGEIEELGVESIDRYDWLNLNPTF